MTILAHNQNLSMLKVYVICSTFIKKTQRSIKFLWKPQAVVKNTAGKWGLLASGEPLIKQINQREMEELVATPMTDLYMSRQTLWP